MNSQFITNQSKLLSEVFKNIIPSTENLYFLVGYFYFSGFEEIHQEVKDRNLKILVGMEVEKILSDKIREYEILQNVNKSRGEVKQNYFDSLVSIINETDYFDTEKKQTAFKYYIEKIINGTLEIKKTLQSNHSKMYLFENKTEYSQGGEFKGTLITGSSNLSVSGLKDRYEINVVFRDDHYSEGKRLFDELWESSVEIVNGNNQDDFMNKVVKKIWIDKLPKPFSMFLRVLAEYFEVDENVRIKLPEEITKGKFINLKYQTDAIKHALNVIERHDGVIVSDVVGLGKSIIASTIAYNLNLKTIVIAPPHLYEQWNTDYRFDFNFNARVYGSGSIEKALEENQYEEEILIIIDEAHKYRNEETDMYSKLHQLCQGNKVVLLSATPFNNRPQDIYSLIRLFQIPLRSSIQTVDNLSLQFREMIREYKDIRATQKKDKENKEIVKQRVQNLAKQIRNVISPLLIRRSRIDLEVIEEYKKDLKEQKISFPIVEDPKELTYELDEIKDLYWNTLEKICPSEDEIEVQKKGGLIGARYKPTAYLKDASKFIKKLEEDFKDPNLVLQSQINLSKFMRRLLVRRFESSVDAFRISLESMIASSKRVKEYYDKLKKVPIYKKGQLPDLDELNLETGDDMQTELEFINKELDIELIEQNLKKYYERGLVFIDREDLSDDFIKDVESDIKLLEEIQNEWFKSKILPDPKLNHFKESIVKQIAKEPDRKIVVFSEFADTVRYVHEHLENDIRIYKYIGSESNASSKKIVKENFDAGIDQSKQKNDYNVLIATDAISEGYNLHRAGTIFNYDIPYNPTRVIQRVGRINRVNKKVFNKLFIYNFFPTATGENEVRIKEITTLKFEMINSLLGEDTKVLTSDVELNAYFKEEFHRLFAEDEQQSWDSEYRNLYNSLKNKHPEVIKAALEIPKRSRIRRTEKKNRTGVVLFGKKSSELAFRLGIDEKESIALGAEDAFELFKAEVNENAKVVSNNFEKIYENAKANLFKKKTEVAKDKGIREAIDKLEILIRLLPGEKDYLEDVKYVIEKLDALPLGMARKVRAISEKKLDADIKKMKEEIPHNYIIEIIKKATQIEEGEESLILAEEIK
ncbi:MAG: RNA polymerase-associated protein RapA [Ignavibacteria bacterium]|nr:RNA polymerase-associated protein RapA [Ignavibacteria bacterium]